MMKSYTDMTMNDIHDIIKRGGDDLVKLNQMVSNHLDSLKLSEKALNVIADTGIESHAECFCGLLTAEDV